MSAPRTAMPHSTVFTQWIIQQLTNVRSGHNGLKSCIQSMPGMVFWRIGVGVGRPLSRDPEDVANFVLQKMSDKLQSQITLVAVPAMQVALEHLARL